MSIAPKLLAALAVVATLLVGVWFWSGVVAPGYWSTIVLGALWFVACAVIFALLMRSRPGLRVPVAGTYVACSLAAAFAFYWTSIRDTVVDEKLPDAVPISRLSAAQAPRGDPLAPQPQQRRPAPPRNVVQLEGPVRPAGHSASGRARVVRLAAGGRRLTLSDGFEIDPGPKVRVYLATDAGASNFKDLGALKGNKGDQQYAIPAAVKLSTYDTVIFWCVPFTQTLAMAQLRPA